MRFWSLNQLSRPRVKSKRRNCSPSWKAEGKNLHMSDRARRRTPRSHHRVCLFLALVGLCGYSEIHAAKEKGSMMKQTTWELNAVDNLGGYATQVLGAPRLIENPQWKAMEFDGQQDGMIVDTNPLAGMERFTLEVIFRPDAGGPKEQRFVHL